MSTRKRYSRLGEDITSGPAGKLIRSRPPEIGSKVPGHAHIPPLSYSWVPSITSGTLFASHKLPLKAYLAAIAIFCNEVKGKSMLAMSRDLGL